MVKFWTEVTELALCLHTVLKTEAECRTDAMTRQREGRKVREKEEGRK